LVELDKDVRSEERAGLLLGWFMDMMATAATNAASPL
jgi:hypothetical protein